MKGLARQTTVSAEQATDGTQPTSYTHKIIRSTMHVLDGNNHHVSHSFRCHAHILNYPQSNREILFFAVLPRGLSLSAFRRIHKLWQKRQKVSDQINNEQTCVPVIIIISEIINY